MMAAAGLPLSAKSIIVTGAGSGIGAEIAKRLAMDGAWLVLNDLDEPSVARVAQGIIRSGGRADVSLGDVSKSECFAGAVARACDLHGRLDVVVNNAGWTHRNKSLLNVSEDEFDRVFSVNVKSIYMSAIHAVPAMTRTGGGSIINIASIAGKRASNGLAWYGASKAAVIAATRSLALELGGLNIRANCVNPGFNEDTGLASAFIGGQLDATRRSGALSKIPLGRFCQPGDVAGAVAYLASDDASFISGASIEVDGARST